MALLHAVDLYQPSATCIVLGCCAGSVNTSKRPRNLLANLSLATVMVVLTVVIHFIGLLALLRILRYRGHRFRAQESVFGQCVLILIVVLGIFAVHTLEVWLYALSFLGIGAIDNFESALYFSTVTFASLGYGDIVLSSDWRLFGAIEAVNGLILLAWSTAFLISLMSRLRSLEHDWLEAISSDSPSLIDEL